jgi:hypothetical protein
MKKKICRSTKRGMHYHSILDRGLSQYAGGANLELTQAVHYEAAPFQELLQPLATWLQCQETDIPHPALHRRDSPSPLRIRE